MIQTEVSHLNYLEHLTVHSSPRILVVYREIFLGILLLLKDYFHQKRMSKSYLMEGLQSHIALKPYWHANSSPQLLFG